MTTARTWFAEHVQLPGGLAADVRLTVDDARFVAVEPHTSPTPGDERLAGVVLPGLADAHGHAFHRALRGRTHADGGTFWTWRQAMYAVAARLDPDLYLALARAVYAEMALAGYTVAGEFHYLHHGPGGRPYADPNAMGAALVAAAADAGIRLTLLDTLYLRGGLGGEGHLDLDEVQRRFSDGSVRAWAERVDGLLGQAPRPGHGGPLAHRVGAAVHSVRAVPRQDLAAAAAAVRELEATHGRALPVHAHVSEQPAENHSTRMHYGASPVALLHEAGLTGPGVTAVHATHLDEDDVATLGGTGTRVCLCPTTERDLADGVGPARALRRAGSPLCLGSDGHNVVDPFEEVRGLEMHERLTSGERGRFTLPELVAAASADGYASLGWPDGGEIRSGALADFVVVDDRSVRTTGSRPGQVLFTATGADVAMTVVGGRVVVADGRHRLGPVAPLLAAALHALREHR